mmetsp:Transcript_20666/g.82521  ORF Transcript_20666/g.82521 Transcript_20666/m.82521 type:complete len:95 (+) Transcript_20666:68-352(+)
MCAALLHASTMFEAQGAEPQIVATHDETAPREERSQPRRPRTPSSEQDRGRNTADGPPTQEANYDLDDGRTPRASKKSKTAPSLDAGQAASKSK